mgnify:CR=1 FL=1
MPKHTKHSTLSKALKTSNGENTVDELKIDRAGLQKLLWTEIEVKFNRYIKTMFEELLEVELSSHIGALRHERSDKRTGYRNGSYSRSLGTLHGQIEDIAVPRLREGTPDYQLFDRHKRRAPSVDEAIGTLFLNGVSTRKLKQVAKDLIGIPLSSSTASTISQKLGEEDLKEFNERRLTDEYLCIFLDGISAKTKKLGIESDMILAAVGMKTDGNKEILGGRLVESESKEDWCAFVMELKQRGLTGRNLKLAVTDGNAGLIAALKQVYPFVKRQRCIAHKLRNVAVKVRRQNQKMCVGEVKLIFAAKSKTEAIKRFKKWKENWETYEERAVSCLEKDLYECLTYYSFDEKWWKKIRTTNIIERSFREVRRRTRPMSIALEPHATERMFSGIATNLNRNWNQKS